MANVKKWKCGSQSFHSSKTDSRSM